MPNKPLKTCSYPGCNKLTRESRCEKHKLIEKKRLSDKYRGNSSERGYNSRWRKYRLQFLLNHPICEECKRKGRIVPATDVDHIRSATGPNDPEFYNSGNHQALCHSCHSRKTVLEDLGFGRRKKILT